MRAKAQCLKKCHESTFIYPDTLKHQSPQRGFQNPSKFLKWNVNVQLDVLQVPFQMVHNGMC
jgi:hypothetical protein